MRRLFAWLWDVQERFLVWWWRLENVGPAKGGVFRLRPVVYHGDEFTLGDGTRVTPGQRIGELHLRNDTLRGLHAQAKAPGKVGWLFRDALIRGLRDLATSIGNTERYSDLRALCGVTMLHYGAEKLGFETRSVRSGLRLRLLRVYQGLLTARHHPLGRARMQRGMRRRDPGEIWMSVDRLESVYGPGSQHRGKADEAEAGVAKAPDDVGQSG